MNRTLLGALALASLPLARAHAELTVIASESADSGLSIADELPAISEQGLVAFVGAFDEVEGAEARRDVLIGDARTGPVRALGLEGVGLDDVTSVALSDSQVAFLARRAGTRAIEVRGAYVVELAPGALPTVLHEGPVLAEPGRGPTRWAEIAMSPGGAIAFNALYDLFGSLYRALPGRPLERLQTGPGELPAGMYIHRAYALDVNDRGQVAVDAELFCTGAPWCRGVQHGIYVLSAPGETARDVWVAAPKSCTSVAIDAWGATVASCYDELVAGDRARFEAMPRPKRLDQWPSSSGLRVDVSASGQVAFAKPSGVYMLGAPGTMPEPVLIVGERLEGAEVLEAKLGGINGRGQLAIFVRVRDASGGEDRRIVRVSGHVTTRVGGVGRTEPVQ